VATFLPALMISLLVGQGRNTAAVLAIALLAPMVLFAASRLMSGRGLKPLYYPIAVVGLGLAAFGVLYAAAPSLVKPMLDHLEIFRWNKGTTVAEMVPTLYQRLSTGELEFSFRPLWETYRASILFSSVGLCILAYLVIRRWEPEKVFLIMWTLVMLLATLAQRRFNYYLVVNVALLTGYLSWEILRFAGLREATAEPVVESDSRGKVRKSKSKSKSRGDSFRFKPSYAYVALTAVAIFSVLYFPTIDQSMATARLTPDQPRYAPSDAWCESLTWLSENTTEPFGDPEFYYARYDTPFDYSAYPEAYGVMAWWDYGYWIVRIGHRPPSQNPGGAIPAVAEFFLAQDESEGQRILDERGARYVILDFDFVTGKFYGAVSVTGKSQQDYFDSFVVEGAEKGVYQLRTFYLPEFYRSMSVRLYSFEGKAVTPGLGDCKVISWTWKEIEGANYKMVTNTQTFDTYEAASAFMAKQSSGNYNIVGNNPFVSPVPLGELKGFALCHDSETTVQLSQSDAIPEVRIFEYLK
jgi:asparagine N-glycosylation enzyme membrane subunit Stt3